MWWTKDQHISFFLPILSKQRTGAWREDQRKFHWFLRRKHGGHPVPQVSTRKALVSSDRSSLCYAAPQWSWTTRSPGSHQIFIFSLSSTTQCHIVWITPKVAMQHNSFGYSDNPRNWTKHMQLMHFFSQLAHATKHNPHNLSNLYHVSTSLLYQ